MREATLAPYGEFWVASADLRDGDLRMEFTGKTDDFDPATDEALLNEGYATVTPLLGIVAAPLKGAGRRGRQRVAATFRGRNRGRFRDSPYTATDVSPKQE